MHVFVTGARGFLMSVLLRRLADTDPDIAITAVDIAEPDRLLLRSLGAAVERIRFRQLDVRDADAVTEAVDKAAPEVIVHGATVTHVPQWEREDPSRFVDVNVMGTTRVLDAARRTGSVRRLVQVSSAAVYGLGTEDCGPLPEDAPLLPDELYGASKVAGELIARRFGQLYDLDIPVVRCTKVFGPMERPSSARATMSLPFHLARSLITGSPVALTERTGDAGGDWISAVDVADALVNLCRAEQPCSGTYNLATGAFTTVPELIGLFGAETTTGPPTADVDMDPSLRHGKNATYSIRNANERLGWRPRPLREQVGEYVEWARSYPETFHVDA